MAQNFFWLQFAPEACPTISLPNIIREGCQEDAYDMVNKNNNINNSEDKEYVESPKILALVSSFTALMLQVKQLAEGERYAVKWGRSINDVTQISPSSKISHLFKAILTCYPSGPLTSFLNMSKNYSNVYSKYLKSELVKTEQVF